jgi:membrane protein
MFFTAMAARPATWMLGGLSPRELGRRVVREIAEDHVTERAAALSYYFLFALFPALLFLTALLSFLPLAGLIERLMAYVRDVLPADAATTVERTIAEVLRVRRTGLASLGLLVTVWASSSGMVSLMSTMSIVYDVRDRRAWWKRRLLALGLTIAFSFFIIAALVVMVFGPLIGAGVANWLGLGALFMRVWAIVSWPIVFGCALIGIELVYWLAPAGRRPWRWVTPGATLALVAWLVMSHGLRIYVAQFANYSATYGSIGGVILLMFWFYLTSVVFLVGAEIDAEIDSASRAARRPAGRVRAVA